MGVFHPLETCPWSRRICICTYNVCSGSGSSSEQFGEARKQLDAVWRIVSDLEDQLEESRLRNTALTETLSETRQLLETECQRQTQGLRHH